MGENFNRRVKILIDNYAEGNTAKFATLINEQPHRVTSVVGKRQVTPGIDFLANILNTFQDVNPQWLISGQGDMLTTQEYNPNKMKEELSHLQKMVEALEAEKTILYGQLQMLQKMFDKK